MGILGAPGDNWLEIVGGLWGFLGPPSVVGWEWLVHMFVVGPDEQMLHKFFYVEGYPTHPWAPWEHMGGSFVPSAPAAVSWGPERLDIFAVGTDRQMLHRAWSPGSTAWHPQDDWEPMGGSFASSPAAVSWGPGRLDIFAVGTGGQMLHRPGVREVLPGTPKTIGSQWGVVLPIQRARFDAGRDTVPSPVHPIGHGVVQADITK